MPKQLSKEQLWELVYRSRRESKIANLAAAAISELNKLGEDFSEKDLSGIKVPGADLKAAKMRNVNLSDADLTGVRFKDADLQEANLADTVFFENIVFKAHDNTIICMDFSNNDKLLATAAVEKGKFLCKLKAHKTCINALIFSPLNELLISVSNDNLER